MGGIGKIWNTKLSPTAAIATSLIAKDALGCYLYVTQATSTKKMTPQQRADVANYDLANGIINIGLQLLAVKPIEKLMHKFVDAKFMKHFFKNLDERLKDASDPVVMKLLKNKKNLAAGAVAALSVIICQYFIKRVVSPFFSVPAGQKAKDLGIIKPKLYPGEKIGDNAAQPNEKIESTFVDKGQITPQEGKKLDIMSFESASGSTNLLERYRLAKEYRESHTGMERAINWPN